MAQDSVVDDKGRIVISKEARISLGLKSGTKVRLHIESDKLVIEKAVSPEEFRNRMRGFIKKGSKVSKSDPIRLKEIWR